VKNTIKMNPYAREFYPRSNLPFQNFVRPTNNEGEEIIEDQPEMAIVVMPKPGELAPPSVQNVPRYPRPDAILVNKEGSLENMQDKVNNIHMNATDGEVKFVAIPPTPELTEGTNQDRPGYSVSEDRPEELLHPFATPGTSQQSISAFHNILPSSIMGPPPTNAEGFIAPNDLPPKQRITGFGVPGLSDGTSNVNKALGKTISAYFAKQNDDSRDLIPQLGRMGLGVAKSVGYGASNAIVNAGVRGALTLAQRLVGPKPQSSEPPLEGRSEQKNFSSYAKRGVQML